MSTAICHACFGEGCAIFGRVKHWDVNCGTCGGEGLVPVAYWTVCPPCFEDLQGKPQFSPTLGTGDGECENCERPFNWQGDYDPTPGHVGDTTSSGPVYQPDSRKWVG